MPYTNTIVSPPIVVDDVNKFYPVDLGGRGWITRLQVSGQEGGTVDLFSRLPVWPDTKPIVSISQTTDGKTKLKSSEPLPLALYDTITIAGNAYAGSTFVLEIIDAYSVIIDVSYSAAATGGTLKLDVTAAEHGSELGLYQVMDQLTILAADSTTLLFGEPAGIDFVTTEPLPSGQNVREGGYNLYCKFSAEGFYRLAVTLVSAD